MKMRGRMHFNGPRRDRGRGRVRARGVFMMIKAGLAVEDGEGWGFSASTGGPWHTTLLFRHSTRCA